jgi:hypothetical protein
MEPSDDMENLLLVTPRVLVGLDWMFASPSIKRGTSLFGTNTTS